MFLPLILCWSALHCSIPLTTGKIDTARSIPVNTRASRIFPAEKVSPVQRHSKLFVAQ